MLLKDKKTKTSNLKTTNSRLSAGASGRGVTPVTIPNTEVKPPSAYGTAGLPGGRVGRCRRSSGSLFFNNPGA